MTISQDRASSFVDRNATEAKRARSNRPPKLGRKPQIVEHLRDQFLASRIPRLGRLREKDREKDYQNGVRTISGIPGMLG
jgi:hypothetical protein